MWRTAPKIRRFAIIAAVFTLLAAGWLYWDREPRYRGVPASSYVLQLMGRTSLPRTSPFEGIREMGSEVAVPALIRVIETEDSALARWYGYIYSKIPVSFRKPLPVPRDPDRIIATAFLALDQFGAQASPAVPSLIDLYQRHPRRTISALNAIGSSASNAVPTLIRGLHPTNLHCFQTASALWRIDPSGDLTAAALSQLPAHGELRTALRNFATQPLGSVVQASGTTSAWEVCEVLGCLRPEAEHVVPALAALLRDENERVRARAAEALGRFGPVASDAAQEIRRRWGDRWRMVREAATNSLKLIESQRP